MKYLLEHEGGHDASSIGFPSIQGCHAVCVVANNGLFGFHNAGGSAIGTFHTRAQSFLNFIMNNSGNAVPQIHHLYGATFAGNNLRGYPAPVMLSWRAELEAYSSALNYVGPISGCDLAKWITKGSAYVEFERLGNGATISIKPWSEVGKTVGINPNTADLQKVTGAVQNTNVVTGVDRTGLSRVVPDVIRGLPL